MRQLRVVGLGDDSTTVILEDPIRHERFEVASDERLRAAARGDVRRLGQMEIEISSPLRPRDIQARIRAGESVEEVAAGGGVTTDHVERFAYPVLLERSRVAELAGRAHPLTDDRPSLRTLRELITATFLARGQDHEDARWDAWKAEDGQWVVGLSWQAGRSDNTASWTYQPGPSGGTVTARDDPARDLIGETPVGPRSVDGRRPESTITEPDDPGAEDEPEEMPSALASTGEVAPAPTDRRRPGGTGSSATATGSSTVSARARAGERGGPERGATERAGSPERRGRPARTVPDQRTHRRDPSVTARPSAPETPGDEPADAGEGDDDRARSKKKNHPIVPSWEDVLLGVRSPRT